jgi:hypothetical protein
MGWAIPKIKQRKRRRWQVWYKYPNETGRDIKEIFIYAKDKEELMKKIHSKIKPTPDYLSVKKLRKGTKIIGVK